MNNNNIFQVSLLTEEEANGTLDVKLPEPPAEPAEEKETKTKDVKESKKEVETKVETPEPAKKEVPEIDVLTPEEAGVEVEEDEETGKKKFKTVDSDKDEIALDYKALAESRIKNGAWEEYENWDELKDTVEWTPELFEQLETEQFNNKLQRALEEEKSSFGYQYKALLEHAKNGGNIQELLPTFQQEFDVDSLNEDDTDDAEELVRAECEAKGWSDKRTKTYLESLKDQGEETLKETARESKASLKAIIDEERKEIVAQQEARAQEARVYWETYNKKVRESIYKDDELSTKEQKDLERFVFDYKHVDPNTGQKYSDFNVEFEKIKQDPAKYAKFIKLVRNFDTVAKKETAKKEAVKEVSFLIRGAQANLSKNKSSETPELVKNKQQKGQWNPFQIKN